MEAVAWTPYSRLIWFVGPSYAHTRKEFDYYAEAIIGAGYASRSDLSMSMKDNQPCTIQTSFDCTVITKTLRDMVRALQSEAPDLICVCEAGIFPEDPLDRIRIRLATARGRAWFSGTTEDAGAWFRDAYDRWQTVPNAELGQSINVPLWLNTQDFPGGVDNPEIASLSANLNRNLFIEKIEGRPAPSSLLVFGELFPRGNYPLNARECPFQVYADDKSLYPVYLAIDPGYNPSHYVVEAIQWHGDEFWVIDEVSARGASHEQMIAMCQQRPWWPNVADGVMDPNAARSHGQGYERTPLEIWQAEGVPLRAPVKPPIEQLIERLRYWTHHPMTGECRFFFDPERCPLLLHEHRSWKYMKDQAGKPVRTAPLKRDCDALKAVGYFAVDAFAARAWAKNIGLSRGAPVVTPWRFR